MAVTCPNCGYVATFFICYNCGGRGFNPNTCQFCGVPSPMKHCPQCGMVFFTGTPQMPRMPSGGGGGGGSSSDCDGGGSSCASGSWLILLVIVTIAIAVPLALTIMSMV